MNLAVLSVVAFVVAIIISCISEINVGFLSIAFAFIIGVGMDLFTTILARFSTQTSVTGVMGFVTGLISVYSSSSGVVLPAFMPTIPGLIQKIGGGNPMAIASSVNVGAHLVDVSPLSTLGALCIANAAVSEDRKALFNKLMIWGLSMSVVGAFVCWVFFGLL